MYRSMMQVVVKNSAEALKLYQQAFNAEILCEYKLDDGNYMHAELDVYGQVIALTELMEKEVIGNTMMFCLHFGEGGEDSVKHSYEVLKDGANIHTPIGKCDFSPLMFGLIDKFGVNWCLFV